MAYKLQVIETEDETWYPIPWAAKEIGISLPTMTKSIDKDKGCKKCVRWHKGHRMVVWPDIKKAFYKIQERVKTPSSDELDDEEDGEDSSQSVVARRNGYKAELLRLELEERAGRLIPLDDVMKAWQNIATLTQKGVLSIADRLAPQLVDVQDDKLIHAKMTAELKQALRNLDWRPSARVEKRK